MQQILSGETDHRLFRHVVAQNLRSHYILYHVYVISTTGPHHGPVYSSGHPHVLHVQCRPYTLYFVTVIKSLTSRPFDQVLLLIFYMSLLPFPYIVRDHLT